MHTLPHGHASLPQGERGLSLGLDEATFERWWYHALLPEDAASFVDLHGGTRTGARFVCALYHLTQVDRRHISSDVIVRAYLAARNLPESDLHSPKVRYEAQALYDDPSVQELLDCVRYRGERAARERIAILTVAKIEDLYERTRTPKSDDEAAEMAINNGVLDPDTRRKTEALALDASIRFMSVNTKERALDATRRDKRAISEAMRASQNARQDYAQPPSAEEFKRFLIMVREAIGPQAFQEAIASVAQPELPTNAQEDDVL